ncbi:hypothetical protein QL285_074426 [Trifolium repens]|nr:hypothetical protein QL285_074426 [Trifolium repens]
MIVNNKIFFNFSSSMYEILHRVKLLGVGKVKSPKFIFFNFSSCMYEILHRFKLLGVGKARWREYKLKPS